MKNLLFVPLALALVAPLSLCPNNLTDRASAQGTITESETLSPEAVVTKNWYRYTTKDGSYSALFPGQPTESFQSDSSVKAWYEDRAKNRAYMTYTFKLPANSNQNESEKAIDVGVALVVQNGATVTDQKKINLNGLPGREITVKSKEGMVMKIRAFVDPKEPAMYMAVVGADNGDPDFPEAQAFLNSVSIK